MRAPLFQSHRVRRAFVALAALTLFFAALAFGAGEVLSAPARRAVGAAPAELEAESILLRLPSGESVAGWFAHGKPGGGAVLLLHGVRSDRKQMANRAKFLHAAGYAVLLIDLPAHGESSGARITFGHREALGVDAAIRFLRSALPDEKTGALGVSLGAASLVLADPSPPLDAVVLESMYPTLAEAVSDRLGMRLGAVGAKLAPVLLWQLPMRIGITADQLRPIAHLTALHAPVLIASGTADLHTTIDETKRLYDAAAAPKELWLVEGAGHVDLHAFNPAAYESRVSAFLGKHLRARSPT